jgi:outer membrane lipoprotein-sorting protein
LGGQALAQTGTSPTTDTLGIDIAKITDPAARAAAEQIQQKLAKVQDYACTLDTTITFTDPKNGTQNAIVSGRELFKQPVFGRREQTVSQRTTTGSLESSTQIITTNGDMLWMQNPQKTGTNKGKVEVSQIDLVRLRKAEPESGKQISQAFRGRVMKPFQRLDATKITVLREDKDAWVFSDGRMEVTVGKNDGALILSKTVIEGAYNTVEAVSDLKVNTGLTTAVFVYIPEPGVEVKDQTETMIQSFARAKQDVQPTRTPEPAAPASIDLNSKESVEKAVAKVKADFRGLSVALEAYKIDYNVFPRTLAPCITTPIAYMASVPLDPFAGEKKQPYNYRTTDPKNWEVWSIGPDGKDDQGGIWYDPAKGFVSPGDIVRTNKGQLTP